MARLSADGSALDYATFLGGGGNEFLSALSSVNDMNVAISGQTFSVDFPASHGAYGEAYGGEGDGFLAQFILPLTESSIVISGGNGVRFLAPPVEGLTVDDLAAQNLVRGVPGYFPDHPSPNFLTAYDNALGKWTVGAGGGDELPIGHAFYWRMWDRDGIGDPEVSVSRAFPLTLTAGAPANDRQIRVELDTSGTRFNFLGNPYGQPLSLDRIREWQGGHSVAPNGPIYVYDNESLSWEDDVDVVPPWGAFRLRSRGVRRNGGARVLTVERWAAGLEEPPPAARVAGPAPARIAFALEGQTTDGRRVRDGALTVTFADDARVGFEADEGDVEKLQVPAPAYALLGARVDGVLVGHDVRPFTPAEVPLALEARGTAPELTLTWDASSLPAGLPVMLVDLETGAEVDVRTASAYRFTSRPQPALADAPTFDLADGAASTDRFVLRVGTALARDRADVDEVTLRPVAPNPSSGAARVPFGLPGDGRVRLAVYDVRGREVAVLVDGPVEAGWHEAALHGAALAAGVYVVRLEAAGMVLTQKAVVVR